MTAVLNTPEGIAFFQLCSQIGALSLEIKGLRHSRGSVYAHVKRQYGLKGSKASVLAQLIAKKEAILAARAAATAVIRKYVTSIEPYDPRIANEVDGHGIGFPHVGLEKIARSMGYGTTHSGYGTTCIYSNTLKAWNGRPKMLGWLIEVTR